MIHFLIHEATVSDLDQAQLECQCACPSCGIGVCVCALAGDSFLRDTWVEARQFSPYEGVTVQTPPRKGSAASSIGLHSGDKILAAEDQWIKAYGDLQKVLRETGSGDDIRLRVRRAKNAKIEEVILVHP